jgi:hypothetical protein
MQGFEQHTLVTVAKIYEARRVDLLRKKKKVKPFFQKKTKWIL